jgi:hypothetical protein
VLKWPQSVMNWRNAIKKILQRENKLAPGEWQRWRNRWWGHSASPCSGRSLCWKARRSQDKKSRWVGRTVTSFSWESHYRLLRLRTSALIFDATRQGFP